MSSSLLNSVIQHSKQKRKTDKMKLAFSSGTMHNQSPYEKKSVSPSDPHHVESRKVEHLKASYWVTLGDAVGEYLLVLQVKDIEGVPEGDAATYHVRVAGPPPAADVGMQNIKAWDSFGATAADSGTGKSTYFSREDLPKKVRDVFDHAFEGICAHWFFTGR